VAYPTSPLLGALLAGTLVLAAGLVAQAYPEPSVVPRSWAFEFDYRDPQLVAVEDIDGRTRWYWYMAYKVVNETGQERLLIPEFAIATDEGHVVLANRGVSSRVFKAIREREGNPLMVSPVKAIGQLLLGEDHARESVAIWPVFDQDIDRMDIFVSGINGETARFTAPGASEPTVLRKTLMLRYHLPGNPERIQHSIIKPHDPTWVMR
jgi:hypothetical protein